MPEATIQSSSPGATTTPRPGTTSATGTNHTTDWMTRRTNYSDAGWDISATVNTTTIWYLPDCTTGYPQMIPLQQDYFVHVQ